MAARLILLSAALAAAAAPADGPTTARLAQLPDKPVVREETAAGLAKRTLPDDRGRGRTLVRVVVDQPPARPTQFCVGELTFLDASGAQIPAGRASASHPRGRGSEDFGPSLLVDGRLHHDFCNLEPTGWMAVELRAPAREVAAYRVGSDCGEDTPVAWRVEACDACRGPADAGPWVPLDDVSGEVWRSGCDGETREYAAQRWRVLRITATADRWCLSRLEVLGERGARVPVHSVRVVGDARAEKVPGDTPEFQRTAARVSKLVGLLPDEGEGDWCSDRDALGGYQPELATFCADVVAEDTKCGGAVPLGEADSPEACARRASESDRCSGGAVQYAWRDGGCGCCPAGARRKPAKRGEALFSSEPCTAIVVELASPARVPVTTLRFEATCEDAPKRLTVEGCLWDRDAETRTRLPHGGCRRWRRLARTAGPRRGGGCEPRWFSLDVGHVGAVAVLDPEAPGVGVSRGAGLPAPSSVALDLGNFEWVGAKLRRIKLTDRHLHDFSRLSGHKVVSATFSRNVSADTVLGRGTGNHVVNLRM